MNNDISKINIEKMNDMILDKLEFDVSKGISALLDCKTEQAYHISCDKTTVNIGNRIFTKTQMLQIIEEMK